MQLHLPPLFTRHASRDTRHSSGVALVITLILLSVITFMAITFLVVSRGEKSTVGSVTEQTTARLAAEQAVEMAQNALMAPIMAYGNPSSVRLLVSTNYQNPLGFNRALGNYLTNVGYTYANGAPLNNFNDQCQNIANLFYLPRVPVYMSNRLTGGNQFVYYLDLNRNGRFDESGWMGQTNNLGQPILTGTNTFATNFAMGDPQWVGILERGNYTPGLYNLKLGSQTFPMGMPHSADNLFISRYAYLVIPTSQALDINYMHNYAKLSSITMASDGFWRNQGGGSWEINLAAFFADLNTNYWNNSSAPYRYDTNYPGFQPNTGTAFDDAVALLRFRYGNTYRPPGLANGKLVSASQAGYTFLANNLLDDYSSGETTGLWPPTTADYDVSPLSRMTVAGFWGSDNPTNIFDIQDLYDRNKIVPAVLTPLRLADRLQQAGTNTDSYNRYTFYRLLEQLGTDSAPEQDKINLNYVNVDGSGNVVPNMAAKGQSWTAIQFFTNAAMRLISSSIREASTTYPDGTNAYYDIRNYLNTNGVTSFRIQIFPTNFYTPNVQRLLQLAANIYDSTTNRGTVYPYYPSVFRPLFGNQNGTNIYIIGYEEVTDTRLLNLPPNSWHDVGIPADRFPNWRPTDMVYGIPLVIGAKKGYPNFNQLASQNTITVSRNLVFHRNAAGAPVTRTNQYLNISITNMMGVEAWNSYNTNFSRDLRLIATADVMEYMTNEFGLVPTGASGFGRMSNYFSISTNITISAGTWAKSGLTLVPRNLKTPAVQSFRVPFFTNFAVLSNSAYIKNQNVFSTALSDPDNQFPVPQLKLNLTTRLRFALVDTAANRIVDYVNLRSAEPPLDITQTLASDMNCDQQPVTPGELTGGSFWCTNRLGGNANNLSAVTYGIKNQMMAAVSITTPQTIWANFNAQVQDKNLSVPLFLARLGNGDKTLDFASPFNPKRVINQYVSWQVNDPFVHYTVPDLTDLLGRKQRIELDYTNDTPLVTLGGRNALNPSYRPWGVNGVSANDTAFPTMTNLFFKDPIVSRSDDWDFQVSKFSNVGWLGRIHRGSPWQTVYLKSPAPDTNFPVMWGMWSGHVITNWDGFGSVSPDFALTSPTNDYHILDLFTTAFTDNASKGQLSVNQTNLAAWSAILSGVIVNTPGTSAATNGFTFIQPAGVYNPFGPTNLFPALVQIVNGINRTRGSNPSGTFASKGDILSVPELTLASPYLQGANPNFNPDWAYERIPQQIMGLLRSDDHPRFVIYAFGQALKPAEHSLVTASGPFFGLCTNYQVTAESVIRAVVRVDNAPTPRAPNNIPRVYVESFNVLPPY